MFVSGIGRVHYRIIVVLGENKLIKKSYQEPVQPLKGERGESGGRWGRPHAWGRSFIAFKISTNFIQKVSSSPKEDTAQHQQSNPTHTTPPRPPTHHPLQHLPTKSEKINLGSWQNIKIEASSNEIGECFAPRVLELPCCLVAAWLVACLVAGWLVGFLVVWLAGLLAGQLEWLAAWLLDWLACCLLCWLLDWLASWLAGFLVVWLLGYLALVSWCTGLTASLVCWLIDWLSAWLLGWLIGWLTGSLFSELLSCSSCWLAS